MNLFNIKIFKQYRLLGLFLILVSFVACKDDFLNDPYYIGEGESLINATINFYKLSGNLMTRTNEEDSQDITTNGGVTGGTPGKAIGNIESLCVLIYDYQGKLLNTFSHTGNGATDTKQLIGYEHTNPDKITSPSDAIGSEEEQAETTTDQVKFKIKMPFGKYRMYAVANMGDLSISTDSKISEAIQTERGLKDIVLSWNEDITKNNQIFGYFTLDSDKKSSGFDSENLIINTPEVKIHSWMKRAVSKVTVAFDGTNLKNDVQIFIKSVEIRDIPNTCYLGADNTPENDEALIDHSQTMIYGSGDVYDENWIGYVSNSHPINGYNQEVVNDNSIDSKEKLKLLHSESTNAFFFFENLQGKGAENTPSDKRQQVNKVHENLGVVSYPNGSDPSDVAWKDAKKYGTYIVVRAYYKSNNEKEGEGEILYRFMLGKDIKLDYNAARNYHYKLTLCFNGWANDVDWHIDYRREGEELRFTNPFYISYLYAQSGMMPIEFDADETVTINSIDLAITSNNWGPSGEDAAIYASPLVYPNQPNRTTNYNDYWLYLKYMDNPTVYPGNGFLTLHKPENAMVVNNANTWTAANPTNYPLALYSNGKFYNDNGQGSRHYSKEELGISKFPVYEAETEDKAHVAWEDGTYYVKLPIWTRARLLIKQTGYTGNNPYTSYYRNAKITIAVKLSDGRTLTKMVTPEGNEIGEIDVQQVRRVVNPKGVWRSSTNTQPFHVVLKTLKSETSKSFTSIKSDGPWRAYVLFDTDADDASGANGFIRLDGAVGTTKASTTFMFNDTEKEIKMTRECIEGVGKTDIDFTINFNGQASKPRYGLIRVEYNNYTCYHLIFVRQGYEADDTFGDGNKWMTTNNISQNTVASDPRDEGSLFVFGNWAGIPSSYNNNHKSLNDWIMIKPNDFNGNQLGKRSGSSPNYTYYEETRINLSDGQTNKTFSSLSKNNAGFSKPNGMRVAKREDYTNKLAPATEDNQNFPIKTGFGVLYGDDATETLSTLEEVYGYKANGPQNRGMRGVFAYDIRNGKNLFFPIGSSGYGHRKAAISNGTQTLTGLLRYSSNTRWGYFDAVNPDSYANGVYDCPLFLNIYNSPGAIYYFGDPYDDDQNVTMAWDINYSTFDFSGITRGNVTNGEDACFVRCIQD